MTQHAMDKKNSSGEPVVKTYYLSFTKEKKNHYWENKRYQQVIIVPTRTIIHLCLDVVAVKDVHGIPRIFFNRDQAKRDLQIHPICLTDSDHYYILE